MANRAWLYCRIDGGHEHEAKQLLDNQEQRLLDYCAQQGLQVAGCTKTVGSSKGELEKLASLGLEKDGFDFLVTVSASRLSRDIQVGLYPIALFHGHIPIFVINKNGCPVVGAKKHLYSPYKGIIQQNSRAVKPARLE